MHIPGVQDYSLPLSIVLARPNSLMNGVICQTREMDGCQPDLSKSWMSSQRGAGEVSERSKKFSPEK